MRPDSAIVTARPSSHKGNLPSVREYSAPARVNLIGEHTDYTGGLVLPMAIPFQSVASIIPNHLPAYKFSSDVFPTQRVLPVIETASRIGDWSDYCVGVLQQLRNRGIEIPPFCLGIRGDVPVGAGLSSSASIEIATALALLAHAGTMLPVEEIAILCQRAENDFVGSPCGIMDQFVVAAAEAGHALLLHTDNLHYELLSLRKGRLADARVVIANSMVKHSIAGGDYGLRRREVEAGQAALKDRFPQVPDLGHADMQKLMACQCSIAPESFLRCRHIISENNRVREAKAAILAGDPENLGNLMTLSHVSQRDDFACSCEEIDFLVEQALQLPGCYGARLTGGGFGGCTVNLVSSERAESFAVSLQRLYHERFQLDAPVFLCEAVAGAVRQKETPASKAGQQERPNRSTDSTRAV